MLQGPGRWGGCGAQERGRVSRESEEAEGVQPSTKPAQPRATKRSVSPTAGVPQRLPAHGQGGGCQPSREQTLPGEQTLTGFLCFRKAASATCPFPTPTQVGHPTTSPCLALSIALGPARPALHHLELRPRFLWGDILSPAWPPGSLAPVERGVWAEGPAGSGLRPGRGATGSWPRPFPGAHMCGQPVFHPRQAQPGHMEVLPPHSGLPPCPCCGAICARVCVLRLNPEIQESGHRGLCGEMKGPWPPASDPPGAGRRDSSWTQRDGPSLPQAALGTRSSAFASVSVEGRGAPGTRVRSVATVGPPRHFR